MSESATITELLRAWSAGDSSAADELMPLVERELHQLAARHMRGERGNHTLQTTALVNEAYLRLANQTETQWQNKAHFLAIASRIMRRVLLDYARSRHTQKREGFVVELSNAFDRATSTVDMETIIMLDDALNRLEEFDPRSARIVEMRHFAGLSVEETAEVLDVAPVTIMRDWRMAKAWLQVQLYPERSAPDIR